MNKHLLFSLFLGFVFSFESIAQTAPKENNWGTLTGLMGMDMQLYTRDSLIGAPEVPEKIRMNSFIFLNYRKGGFYAGARFEFYQPKPLLGIDERFQGQGVPYYFAGYQYKGLDVTAGGFYEQFGNGLALRAYEARQLGFDNFIQGFRIKYNVKGIYLKGVFGRQRDFWSWSPGTVRALDAEFNFNEMIGKMEKSKVRLSIGGSIVSTHRPGEEKVIGVETLKLPQNVATAAGRLNFGYENFTLNGEFAYKFNDPSAANNYMYKPGTAALVTASYAGNFWGVSVGAKRIDNFDSRMDREAVGNRMLLNWIPMLNKQHTYNLAASIYPYAVQYVGEQGLQADLNFSLPRGSKLGGKYGMDININASIVYGLDTTNLPARETVFDGDTVYTPDRYGYTSSGKLGNQYFQDFNIEITKRFNKKWKLTVMYMQLWANLNTLTVSTLGKDPFVHAHIGVADLTWRINTKHSLRMELEGMYTKQDQGSWLMGLLEWTFAPHWSVSVMNQYNVGHPQMEKRLNYPLGSVVYNMGSHRFQLSYGRQRAGVLCIGGICRAVPAANGLTFGYIGSF